IVNDIFRSAHTLKGMSATMGYDDLANLTHKMENVLDAIRNHQLTVTPELLDIVFEADDHLEAMILSIAEGGDGKRDVTETVEKLQAIEKGESPIAVQAQKEVAVAATMTEKEVHQTKSSYDEFEYTVLQQSKEQGFEAYEVTVSLREDCLLKAARVYMIFEVL